MICCKPGKADEVMAVMRRMREKLRLRVNERKTRTASLPDETFDFLGYTFGRCYSIRTGRPYLGPKPRKSKVQQICQVASVLTDRRWYWKDVSQIVASLNARLGGWANYFGLGPVQKAYRTVDKHVRKRMRQWLCGKHRVAGDGYTRYPDEYLHEKVGLIQLLGRPHRQLWAKG